MKTTATSQSLTDLLVATVTGEAQDRIDDAYEALYPVTFDPTTGALRQTEDN